MLKTNFSERQYQKNHANKNKWNHNFSLMSLCNLKSSKASKAIMKSRLHYHSYIESRCRIDKIVDNKLITTKGRAKK